MSPPFVTAMEIQENEGIFTLDVSPQMEVFQGHFPGHPILAGVVQLDWVMHLATAYLGISQRVAQDFKVKFHRIITPNMPLTLSLQLDHVHGRLLFHYRSKEHVMSQGQISLKPKP